MKKRSMKIDAPSVSFRFGYCGWNGRVSAVTNGNLWGRTLRLWGGMSLCPMVAGALRLWEAYFARHATALPSSDVPISPKHLANFAGCEPETSQGANLKLRRVRSWNIAGCEVRTSQGAKLEHRRVRSWDIAGCEVGTSQGAKCWSRSGGFIWSLSGCRRR